MTRRVKPLRARPPIYPSLPMKLIVHDEKQDVEPLHQAFGRQLTLGRPGTANVLSIDHETFDLEEEIYRYKNGDVRERRRVHYEKTKIRAYTMSYAHGRRETASIGPTVDSKMQHDDRRKKRSMTNYTTFAHRQRKILWEEEEHQRYRGLIREEYDRDLSCYLYTKRYIWDLQTFFDNFYRFIADFAEPQWQKWMEQYRQTPAFEESISHLKINEMTSYFQIQAWCIENDVWSEELHARYKDQLERFSKEWGNFVQLMEFAYMSKWADRCHRHPQLSLTCVSDDLEVPSTNSVLGIVRNINSPKKLEKLLSYRNLEDDDALNPILRRVSLSMCGWKFVSSVQLPGFYLRGLPLNNSIPMSLESSGMMDDMPTTCPATDRYFLIHHLNQLLQGVQWEQVPLVEAVKLDDGRVGWAFYEEECIKASLSPESSKVCMTLMNIEDLHRRLILEPCEQIAALREFQAWLFRRSQLKLRLEVQNVQLETDSAASLSITDLIPAIGRTGVHL